MKHIGHIDGAVDGPTAWRTHPLGMLAPHELFIPSPGERENVSADHWEHIGWIHPDRDGGTIYAAHANAVHYDNARPAYIRRKVPDAAAQPAPSTLFTVGTDDLVKEVLDFCNTRLDEHRGSISFESAYADCNKANTYLRELVGRINSHHLAQMPPEPPMSFYDHAFIAAATDQMRYHSKAFLNEGLISNAHAIAGMLTRNRANRP